MSGFVYAIAEGPRSHKIGITTNLKKRLYGLQTGHARKLHLAYAASSAEPEAVEREVHARLADRRRSGEWFAVARTQAIREIGAAAATLGITLTPVSFVSPGDPIPYIDVSPVRAWRKSHGRSLQWLADRCGVTKTQISRIECGLSHPGADVEDALVEVTSLTRDEIAVPRLLRKHGRLTEVAA